MLYLSSNNYPGGEALLNVNKAIKSEAYKWDLNNTSVYVCNLAAQSGFTRFLQLPEVYYNKDNKLVLHKFAAYKLIYLVLEPDEQQLYLGRCNFLSNQSTCQLSVSTTTQSKYECQLLRNITAFDRIIDFKVNFRTVLNIYKCFKV